MVLQVRCQLSCRVVVSRLHVIAGDGVHVSRGHTGVLEDITRSIANICNLIRGRQISMKKLISLELGMNELQASRMITSLCFRCHKRCTRLMVAVLPVFRKVTLSIWG